MYRILLLLLAAAMAHGATTTISDTLHSSVGGAEWTGRITVSLNAPQSAQPLYAGSTSLAGWQAVYCLGVTGTDCTAATAAGAVSIVIWPTDQITPGGTSYTARYQPTRGAAWSETWVIATGNTTLRQIRSTTTPTPSTVIALSQLASGGATTGQYLQYSGTSWGPVTLSALSDPTTTTGDIIYRGASGLARLGIGSTGQVLKVAAGIPSWAAESGGGAVSSVFTRTGAVVAVTGDYTYSQVTGAVGGGGNLTSAGTIPYVSASGVLNQDSGALVWDATNNRLGINAPSPTTALDVSGTVTATAFAGPLTGNVTGNVSGSSGSTTGNAATATALQTARNIAGVSFNGTANISIPSTGLSDTADLVRNNAANTWSTGAQVFTAATLRVPNSTTLPVACTVGDSYMDTDATSGARWFLCESTNTWAVQGGGGGGSGTVTSVAQSFTGGLISVAGSPITTSGTLALTVAGTSGGIPYFSSASTWASSGALTSGAVMLGGGAGGAPTVLANSSSPATSQLWLHQANAAASATQAALLIGPTAMSGWNSSGTYLGISAQTGFAGRLVDFRVNNTSQFLIDSSGSVRAASGFIASSGASGFSSDQNAAVVFSSSSSGASSVTRVTGSAGTAATNYAAIRGSSTYSNDQLRVFANNPMVAIGQRAAASSSSNLSLYIEDNTTTTGVTRLSIQEGAGQSTTPGFEYRLTSGTLNNGTLVWSIAAGGEPTWGSTTEATCASGTRGQVVMVHGGAGVADTFRICRKDAADVYAWTALY